jgi:hypothetical protein
LFLEFHARLGQNYEVKVMKHAARDFSEFQSSGAVNSAEALPLDVQAALADINPVMGALSTPDVPGSVGGLVAASYFALLGALFFATAGSGYSIFMIVIAVFFATVFFTVPRLFLAVEPSSKRPTLMRFMEQGLGTYTGHCSGSAALVQMLIVPVALTFGVLAMGITAAIIL